MKKYHAAITQHRTGKRPMRKISSVIECEKPREASRHIVGLAAINWGPFWYDEPGAFAIQEITEEVVENRTAEREAV